MSPNRLRLIDGPRKTVRVTPLTHDEFEEIFAESAEKTTKQYYYITGQRELGMHTIIVEQLLPGPVNGENNPEWVFYEALAMRDGMRRHEEPFTATSLRAIIDFMAEMPGSEDGIMIDPEFITENTDEDTE